MLQIRLLGQFDVRLDGKRIVISSRAGQSLLAYLAMTAGTSHRREKLAGTLWPDSSEENARKNLRQELWRIRKAIPTQNLPEADDYLIADEYTLTFNREADYWLDVSILEKSDPDVQSLTSSLSLYQGELLPGFYEDWVVLERERLQTLFESKMEHLVEKLVESELWTAVQEQCERWLVLGFVSEPAYRALMLSYNARGDMAKVSSIYQRCVEDLQDHFGVEPSAETHALFNGLLKGAKVSRRIMPAQPSGAVTFLFTDIQGSTRLLDKLGEQYAISLADHHHILRTMIQKWKGTEIDTQGDAFFVTFTRASDAVQCAAEVQQTLASHTWPQEEPIRVRMGLHTGEPLIASTGYVGMDVHRAARIGDTGHGGQVLLSQTTRDLVMQDLPPGIAIKDLGEHRLKDMKYPAPIYQLVVEGLQVDFPPLKMKFAGNEPPTPGEAPFMGLQYFEEADSDLFFGRELLTTKLVNRLFDTQFLSVIIGASGSGKSSVVRAGLIPALKNDQAHADWQIHIITPTAHPLETLATELTRDSDSVATTARLISGLMQEPRSLSLYLARTHSKHHNVLVVDQFEELFTLCHDEFEREAFIDNLLFAISPSPTGRGARGEGKFTLIITLRADFYAHLAQYPELREAVAQRQEYIGPMTAEELRRAIEGPAKRGHWEFEPGLVDLILRDVGDEPGALPLLSHALLETWKRRVGHILTLKGYADAGGVHGAIAHTAECIYQGLSSEDQTITRDIFLRLTELGEGTEDTRRRASFEELMSHTKNRGEVRNVLNRLADARLITLGEDTAEVAHEALIREWPTLHEWLNQDREGLRLHRHLTEAAYEWELLGRDPGALYRGAHLAQAREWTALHPKVLNVAERAFLSASIEQEEREEQEREELRQRELAAARELAETQRQSASRLKIRNHVITIVGSITFILALLAGIFGVQSNRNAKQAQANFASAEAQRLAALANNQLQQGGNPELIALLSLRSMNTRYTTQGDAALAGAATLDYPVRVFISNDDLTAIAFSRDGKYLLVGSNNKIAHLWNVQTGQEVKRFSGHNDFIYSVAFSPNGQSIVTGSGDNTTRLWNTATGQELRRFDGLGLGLSADGKYILTTNTEDSDYRVRLWDVQTGKILREFIGHTEVVTSATFSHDGRHVLTGSFDKTARLWDAATGQELVQFPVKAQMEVVRFSPDGKTVATSGADSIVRLWDARTGRKLKEITGHTGPVTVVAFSPNGKYLLTRSDDGTARLWDVKTGQEVRRLNPTGLVWDAVFSPDGKYIAIDSGNRVMLWSITPHPSLAILEHHAGINGVAFSPDGKLALTGGTDGIARLWDLSTGQELRQFIGHTTVINFGVTFSPDGKQILTGSWDTTVILWDTTTGQKLHVFTTKDAVNSVVFSPDGKYILAGSNDKTAWLWDATTGQEVKRFGPTDVILRAVFSSDGNLIATAGFDGGHVWDRATGQELLKLDNHNAGMNSIAFSPDAKYILSIDADNIVRLWDVATGEELRQFPHAGWTATFSPDGRYVATAGFDGTVRLWDAQTTQEIRRLSGHTAGVEDVDFSPDGKYLLTGSDDGTARLWDVDYHTTIHYLCSVLLRDFTEEEHAQYGITGNSPTCPGK